jgi:hypothetical protein
VLHQFSRFSVLLLLTVGFALLGYLILTVFAVNERFRDRFEYFLATIITGLSFVVAVPILLGVFSIALSRNNIYICFITIFIFLGVLCLIRLLKGKSIFPVFYPDEALNFYLLMGLFIFLIVVRLVQVKDVYVPNWMDGLIHTQLVNKLNISEKIGFERIYHVGFHAGALVIHDFLNIDLPETVLLFSQWLSAVCGVAIYSILRKYTRNLYASLISLLIYSLFLLFPSFLVTWGRYPYLLGLSVLPLAVMEGRNWVIRGGKNYFLALFLVFSLLTMHYGTFLIYLSFIVTNIAYKLTSINSWRKYYVAGKLYLTRFFALILPLVFVVFSKLMNLLSNKELLSNIEFRADNVNFSEDLGSVIRLVLQHDHLLLVCVIVGLGIFSLWKKKLVWLIICWPVVVALLTWVQYSVLNLTVSSYLNLVVFLSIPFVVLCGVIARHLASLFATYEVAAPSVGRVWLLLLILAVAFFGAKNNIKIIEKNTISFTPQDYSAVEWIKGNTSKSSVFLIESFFWGDKLMPSDGGGWIELLTGRSVVYPDEVGEIYDMCVYMKDNDVDYLYLQDDIYEDNFGLRLTDLHASYNTVYTDYMVMIVSVECE